MWANTACEPWAISSLVEEPERLETDRSTIVWPPIATPGGVSEPPDPIFSLTRKCGVETGGCVWLWRAARGLLLLERVLRVDDGELDVDVAFGFELADDVAAAVVALEPPPVCAARVEDLDEPVEVEWLPDPHAATSSAVASAAAVRLTIHPA